jgi:predicted Fe-S protein YdhL (DUF1289 family)
MTKKSCLSKCEWDLHNLICLGCGRTLRQIEDDLMKKAKRGRNELKRTNVGKS